MCIRKTLFLFHSTRHPGGCRWGVQVLSFEGVWAVPLPSSEPRTSARSESWSGTALPKPLTRANLLKCFVFQQIYGKRGPGTRFFMKSLKRRAPTAVARLVCVEMIASETPERCRSTFLENVCFCANKRLDFIDFVFYSC